MFACRQEYCKKLHGLIDKIDEERYDIEAKVQKADKEVNSRRQDHVDLLTVRKLKLKAFLSRQIEDLKIKVVDLIGVKKPALKKVRMSADTMLKALLGSKHTVNMDLRSNLKQVKKEAKEEVSVLLLLSFSRRLEESDFIIEMNISYCHRKTVD